MSAATTEHQPPSADQVKSARVAAGLTQAACAEIFGYKLRAWQRKEDPGEGNRSLSVGEYNYLLLLAGEHPEFQLQTRAQ